MAVLEETQTNSEFTEWFRGSDIESASEAGFPRNINDFISVINREHKNIRKLLGGISKTFNFSIPDLEEFPKETFQLKDAIDSILFFLPDYLNKYNLKREDLLKSYIGKIKTNKHIMTYAKKIGINVYDISWRLSGLSNILNELLQKKQDLSITIDTSPKAFVQLGFYGVDDGVCYTENRYKYNLAMGTDSFIVIFRENNKIIGRCWGFISDEKELHLTNLYGEMSYGNIIYSFKEIYKDIFEEDVIDIKRDLPFSCGDKYIYINNDPHFSFSSEKINIRRNKYINITEKIWWTYGKAYNEWDDEDEYG